MSVQFLARSNGDVNTLPNIELIKVSKSFGSLNAVKEFSLVVRRGEIRGLLGPNGSGKSTTMKMILGLLKPDSGSVNVCGIDVRAKPVEARRTIGYVPETPFLYEYLSASEYMDLVGVAYGLDRTERKKRACELLQALQMDKHVNEVMSGYSQGMRQKIALVSALIHKPKVLILDEPLNGLDPRSAKIVKEILHHLAEEGVSILFSTHVLEIADAICSKITIINNGSTIAEGTSQEIKTMAGLRSSTLEDVFLKLTGSEDTAKVVEALKL
ncbi:MAG TPA: ABC transporter ATP-binding protein [Candidatus Binatia bacterium]|nr:ABC transporter ATP-binding protein [Candidatus Binatia bacterium]